MFSSVLHRLLREHG